MMRQFYRHAPRLSPSDIAKTYSSSPPKPAPTREEIRETFSSVDTELPPRPLTALELLRIEREKYIFVSEGYFLLSGKRNENERTKLP